MRNNISQLHSEIKNGSFLAIARGITIVENELEGYEHLLSLLTKHASTPVIGITGPPGAGKSTLVNALLHYWLGQKKKIAVLAVDPSSPFNYGAILGDRIRMSEFYTNPDIYIRSLASRGALGGLSAKIVEMADVVKEGPFDLVLVETVGVGQSEVEVAGLADCTIVVLVPEAGDEVQAIKAGIMEVADIFVVNKADRDNADAFYNHLRMMVHEKMKGDHETPVVKTVASTNTGIAELAAAIRENLEHADRDISKKTQLLVQKCIQLIQSGRMKDIDRDTLRARLADALQNEEFNLYNFTRDYLNSLSTSKNL